MNLYKLMGILIALVCIYNVWIYGSIFVSLIRNFGKRK